MSSKQIEKTLTFSGSTSSDEVDLDNRTPISLITKGTYVGATLQGTFSQVAGGTKNKVHDSVGNEVCKITSAGKLQAGSLFTLDISDWIVGSYLTLLSGSSETTTVVVVLSSITE